MPADVVVLGYGMMTAVGLTAPETLASVRAGTARFIPSEMRDQRFERFTVAEVPQEGLPALAEKNSRQPLSAREAKMLRLATGPLAKAALSVPHVPAKLPLFLGLPETETRIPLDRARFAQLLAAQVACLDAVQSRAEFAGRAGGLAAIGSAVSAIGEGRMPFALAGGVDSFLDLYVLATLDMEGRIKSRIHLDGFIPGEAAAFVLLASRTAADGIGAKPLARISPAAQATEPGHLYSKEIYRGDGLAQAVTQLFAATPPSRPVAVVYSSMNGESHWGKEWSVAFIRNQKFISPGAKIFHPADSYGDVGAAAGPLLVALAADGIANGYRPEPALVYCSNDRAPRAALCIASL